MTPSCMCMNRLGVAAPLIPAPEHGRWWSRRVTVGKQVHPRFMPCLHTVVRGVMTVRDKEEKEEETTHMAIYVVEHMERSSGDSKNLQHIWRMQSPCYPVFHHFFTELLLSVTSTNNDR